MMMKKFKCTSCGEVSPFDPDINLREVICERCGNEGSTMVVFQNKAESTPEKKHKYIYFASNANKDEHDIKYSKYGEVEALSEIQAYRELEKKYKYAIVVGRGKENDKSN